MYTATAPILAAADRASDFRNPFCQSPYFRSTDFPEPLFHKALIWSKLWKNLLYLPYEQDNHERRKACRQKACRQKACRQKAYRQNEMGIRI